MAGVRRQAAGGRQQAGGALPDHGCWRNSLLAARPTWTMAHALPAIRSLRERQPRLALWRAGRDVRRRLRGHAPRCSSAPYSRRRPVGRGGRGHLGVERRANDAQRDARVARVPGAEGAHQQCGVLDVAQAARQQVDVRPCAR